MVKLGRYTFLKAASRATVFLSEVSPTKTILKVGPRANSSPTSINVCPAVDH